jgi:cadmium resistance protein CadD (predicted permease)
MKFDYKRMFKYENNVGGKEKQYRIYGGSALVIISIFTASIFFLLVGSILIATGFFGFCPINAGLCRSTGDAPSSEAPST